MDPDGIDPLHQDGNGRDVVAEVTLARETLQNARSALELSDRGYVIQRGLVSHTGTGASLLADGEVRRSFLAG